MTYDVLVIGAGPAGCSAALTLRARGKSVLVAHAAPGALEKARRIDNYPGLPGATGRDMHDALMRQMTDAGVEIMEGLVTKALPMGDAFSVLVGSEILSARGLVIAAGAARQKPLPGEEELLGRGVSYCATCDGMFYRGKRVAVIGAWAEAAAEAAFLSTVAAETVYFSEKKHDLSALPDAVTVNAEKPVAIAEKDGVAVVTADNTYSFDGVFVLRPAVAMTALMSEIRLENGAIAVDRQMRTNVPRVCAAGDAAGAPYQIAKAVGEGNLAALSLSEDLENMQKL